MPMVFAISVGRIPFAFNERYIAGVADLRAGDRFDAPTTLAPLSSQSAADELKYKIRQAVGHGHGDGELSCSQRFSPTSPMTIRRGSGPEDFNRHVFRQPSDDGQSRSAVRRNPPLRRPRAAWPRHQ